MIIILYGRIFIPFGLEEYPTISPPVRHRYQSASEKLNRHWIQIQFKNLGANWIIVIDGEVVNHGTTLGDYPPEDKVRQLQQKTGKCTFVFFSEFLHASEEYPAPWHRTRESTDFYPDDHNIF